MACSNIKGLVSLNEQKALNSKTNTKKTRKKDVHDNTTNKGEKMMSPALNPRQLLICEQHFIQKLTKPVQRQPKALFVCSLCQYYCNSWSVVESHIDSQRHFYNWMEAVDEISVTLIPEPLKEQKDYLCKMIKQLVKEHGISEKSKKTRYGILDRFDNEIKSTYPGCTVTMYGSSGTNMGLKTSDVNMNLNIPTSMDAPKIMLHLYRLILSDNASYREVQFDATADTPTIAFIDIATSLQCNIALCKKNACELTQLLLQYASLDNRVASIIIVFRLWAHLCRLDRPDYGTLPSYAFPILVIYYLQQLSEPIVPVLSEYVKLHQNDDKEDKLKKWKSKNKMSLGELWLDLFRFYLVTFQYHQHFVCIQSSKPMKRSVKKWPGKRLAIEDPLASYKNVCKSLFHGKTFTYFMGCMRSTYLYFATPHTEKGPIFRRVQRLPSSIQSLNQLLVERDTFLKYVLEHNHYFQSEDINGSKKLQNLKISDTSKYSYEVSEFIVTPEQAEILFKKFNPWYLSYSFIQKNLVGGKDFPMVCITCREEGHHMDECPEDTLPPLEPLPSVTDEYLKKLTTVCETVCSMWEINGEELCVRKRIVKTLESFISSYLRGVSLTLFGSTCNGFGHKASDIDICLTFKGNVDGKGINFAGLIEDLYIILSKCRDIYNLIPITTAKVPILKFSHRETNLNGDISFYNILAQENTNLLWTYCIIDRRVKVLGFALKRFTKLCGISDASKGSLSSYAYILMLIYFLQQCNPPVLPVLQEIFVGKPAVHLIDDCNTYYFNDINNLHEVWPDYGKNVTSVGELWLGFFRFYTEEFNFKRDVISIRMKKPMLRFEKLWNSKCMAIEDPFDIHHNLGVGLSKKMYNYIIKSFRKARVHFGNPRNMPSSSSLPYLTEKFFSHQSFRGSPPDRGCPICKRIGHRCKECPSRRQNKTRGCVTGPF